MAINALVRRSELIQVNGMKKDKGRQKKKKKKKRLIEVVKKNMSIREVIESIILDGIE